MAQLKITEKQGEALLAIRKDFKAGKINTYERKRRKGVIMDQIHKDHETILGKRGRYGKKIKLFIENPDNPLFLVIRDKRTGMPFDDGKPEAKKPAITLVKPVTKAKPKVTAKAAAKKVATKAKPAAKKASAKKAATKAKTPAKKSAAKKTAKKPVKK